MTDTRSRLTLSKDDAARVQAVEELGQNGAGSISALIPMLDDPSWAVRRAVVAALARLGAPAVAPLIEVLERHRGHESRLAAAVDALAASRAPVEAAMMALIDADPAPPIVCDAVQVLGRRKSAGATERLERLTAHADDNVAVAAIEALGRIGGGVGVATLMTVVAAGNFFRTFPALEVLGGSGDRRAVEPLLRALENPLFAVEAARALGHCRDERAVGALLERLRNAQDSLVCAAAVALNEIYEHVHERVGSTTALEAAMSSYEGAVFAAARAARCLPTADPAEQVAICRVLGWLQADDGVAGLFAMLAAASPVAHAASTALKRFGRRLDARVAAELRRADSEARLLLLPLVAGSGAGLAEVVACLDDPDPSVRHAACAALARCGDSSIVARLFTLLGDPDSRVAQAATAAIQSLGSAETESLAIAAARSSSLPMRRAGLRIIAYFGYAGGLDALLAGAEESDERLRDAAIAGLAYLEAPRAVEALLAATTHVSAKTRAAAVRALGQVAATTATREVLHRALGDADAWVRYYACQSLGKLRDRGSDTALIRLVADPAGQVRVAVIEALAQLQTPAAIEALRRAAGSDDGDLQRAAIVGLGLAKRVDTLPLLVDAAASPDAATRLVALAAVARLDAPQVIAVLRRAALDPDETVRVAAVEHLALQRTPAATAALIDLIGETALRDRIIAALAQPADQRLVAIAEALEVATESTAPLLVGALARMQRADAVAALIAALGLDNVHARRAAADALARLRSPAARAALKEASVSDPDAEVRTLCSIGLGDG